MSRFIMMIGVPGCGKSTYIENRLKRDFPSAVIISTDNYIEQKAKEEGKTYSDVFQSYIKSAETEMCNSLKRAIHDKENIIWDQTNLTVKSRSKKLEKIPDFYTKYAIMFRTPPMEELKRRLASRPGKTIPEKVLNQMIESYEPPTHGEGFEYINYR